jgi:DNA-directed RNA polymerase specialized sigma24 family protein
MSNPAGYLYRVGVSSVKPDTRTPVLTESITWGDPWVEPSLEKGLAQLSDLQRTALVLHHSFTWTYEEIADLLGVSVSTVRSHIERGMRKLRQTLKVVLDG